MSESEDLEKRVKRLEDLNETQKELARVLSDIFFTVRICNDMEQAEKLGQVNQKLEVAGELISEMLEEGRG